MTTTAREAIGDDRRAAIVAAALELFAARGYKGTSLALIAERVGITQQGVLYHFRSKDQLLVAALEERDERDGERWAVHAAEHPHADVLELAVRLVEHNGANEELVRLYTVLAADSTTVDHPAHQFFRQRYAASRSQLHDALDAAHQRSGRRGPSAALVLAVMDGLQLQWLLDPQEFDMVGEFRHFVELVRRQGA